MKLLLAFMLMISGVAHAWGPATHMVLAERATGRSNPETLYGAMVADMNQAAFGKPEVASLLRQLTHFEYHRLEPSCFALGFASHNDAWGVDWFAHQYWRPETPENAGLYSTVKIRQLSDELNINNRAAEFFFEMAIDYLLRKEMGPALGRQIQQAATAYHWGHEQALVDAFAAPLAEDVPGFSLEEAQSEIILAARLFQMAMLIYGGALADRNESSTVMALSSMAVVYLGIDYFTAIHHLNYAVALCQDDYQAELDRISGILQSRIEAFAPDQMEECGALGCLPAAGKTSPASAAPLLALGLLLTPRFTRRRRSRKTRPLGR